MAELKIDKEWVRDAVQPVIDDVKANYIHKSVIEDIKADIADFMAEIPMLGNCKEGWHNAGQRIGLEQACEIIDSHISGKE